jgi:dTDP-4-dehydrorhamnose reductase
LARKAVELAGLDPGKVVGVPDAMMRRRAPRLKYGVMEMGALRQAGFALPRSWQDALAEYVHAGSALWKREARTPPA